MYNSIKQKKVQLSEDIFPVEAWELISNSREDDDVIIIDDDVASVFSLTTAAATLVLF